MSKLTVDDVISYTNYHGGASHLYITPHNDPYYYLVSFTFVFMSSDEVLIVEKFYDYPLYHSLLTEQFGNSTIKMCDSGHIKEYVSKKVTAQDFNNYLSQLLIGKGKGKELKMYSGLG